MTAGGTAGSASPQPQAALRDASPLEEADLQHLRGRRAVPDLGGRQTAVLPGLQVTMAALRRLRRGPTRPRRNPARAAVCHPPRPEPDFWRGCPSCGQAGRNAPQRSAASPSITCASTMTKYSSNWALNRSCCPNRSPTSPAALPRADTAMPLSADRNPRRGCSPAALSAPISSASDFANSGSGPDSPATPRCFNSPPTCPLACSASTSPSRSPGNAHPPATGLPVTALPRSVADTDEPTHSDNSGNRRCQSRP